MSKSRTGEIRRILDRVGLLDWGCDRYRVSPRAEPDYGLMINNKNEDRTDYGFTISGF
jgi:hypothetical protein